MYHVSFFYGGLTDLLTKIPVFIAIVALAPMFLRIVLQGALALIGVQYGQEMIASAIMFMLALALVPVLMSNAQGAVDGTIDIATRLLTNPLQMVFDALGM